MRDDCIQVSKSSSRSTHLIETMLEGFSGNSFPNHHQDVASSVLSLNHQGAMLWGMSHTVRKPGHLQHDIFLFPSSIVGGLALRILHHLPSAPLEKRLEVLGTATHEMSVCAKAEVSTGKISTTVSRCANISLKPHLLQMILAAVIEINLEFQEYHLS
ncbi:hypothetical protein PIB30_080081 [Stylosanthes scabra]|uniref:Uncharacterized protein n=1 Tax=Stylosanthes scabra TaxID=79078 RepID=A0ABU6STB5_9FABA|nr:hypothetical protein [Stylosanthes scabra]